MKNEIIIMIMKMTNDNETIIMKIMNDVMINENEIMIM